MSVFGEISRMGLNMVEKKKVLNMIKGAKYELSPVAADPYGPPCG